jgi:DNA-binding Xre family transcriptional regulator
MCNLKERLAKTLKDLRGDQSQLQFAKKLGISHTSLNRIEMGEQNVTLATLELLCKRLKCRLGDLFPENE